MTLPLALSDCLEDPGALLAELRQHGDGGVLLGLALAEERQALRRAVLGDEPADAALRQALLAWGPSVVLGSGGSSGGRRWCLQPLRHLEASAEATATWLEAQGLDPAACLHLAALPLHHVSGLLPLIRCERWGAELRWLPPPLLRQPERLPEVSPLPPGRPVLLSLVPTQLGRLLGSPAAVAWLAQCSVIWVGGAALPEDQAQRARAAGLPLAPCYGATETAAMVCALPPARFLAGEGGCGPALADVELRLEDRLGAIALRTGRLSPGWWQAGELRPFAGDDGWWRSGDAGGWSRSAGGAAASLVLRGRLDGAISSGGETVFPEQVRQRLLDLIGAAGVPVAELLLLAEEDPHWGQRLVALVRLDRCAGRGRDPSEAAWDGGPGPGAASGFAAGPAGAAVDPHGAALGWAAARGGGDAGGPEAANGPGGGSAPEDLELLQRVARQLPPPQRPCRWLLCPELAPSAAGKWELGRWRTWLASRPLVSR